MTFPRRPPATVLVIAGFVLGAPRAAEAAGPKLELSSRATRVDDVEPPEAAPPPAETVPPPAEPAPPPAEPAPPPAEPAPPPDDGGGFQIDDETADEDLSDVETVETVAPSEDAPPPETPPEDEGNWSFEVTDLTEDEAALAKELEVEKVEVKGAKGTVVGTLKDSVSGEPLVGAQVEAVGTKFKTKTGLDGSYTLDLPPGTYEVRFRYDTSQPLRVSQVVVEKDKTQTISRDLVPLAGAGETVKVEAEMNRESEGARLLQRKDSAAARDLMSRDEISKSGGGSTSSVARRIVGSTVIGGRFLFIRGLGHRYGNTLFDGARVPSPEPELRTVPLDIFPSGALSAINIQKTFTPDVPGDFVGGSTQLESREVPDELVVELGAEVGANTATTGRNMVTNGAFPLPDAFGFGNLPRALPGAIPRDAAVQRNLLDENFQPLYTSDDIERLGEAMYTDTRVRRGSQAPPNFGFKATAGWGKDLGHDGSRIGFLAAASFRNKHQTLRESLRLYGVSNDTLQTDAPQVSYESFKTTYNSAWSTIGLVKGRITRNHRLSLLGLYSRDADDETRELRGTAIPVAGQARLINTRLRYVMRSVLLTRLGGEHVFPNAKKLKVDWFGSYAQARRDDPAIRDMLFQDSSTPPSGIYRLDATNGGGKQLFLDLVDDTESGAANLTLPFKQWKQLDSKFKVGVWIEGKQRTFATRRFAFQPISGLAPEDIPTGTDNIINDSRIGGGTPTDVAQPFFLNETTRPLDNYTAGQEVYATYAMLELPLVRWFTIAGGARFEASRMRVDPFDPFAQAGDMPNAMLDDGRTRLDDNDVLPAASLIFKPTDKMNVRLSGTRTLARPEFRELAPFEFQDFVGGIAVIGNPALVTTRVWNADLRWEWFPTAAEVVSASVFYKWFDDPIERVAQPRANGFSSFRNADAAQNVGLELEARKNLEFIGRALKHFSIGANFAYIYSRVRLRGRCDPDNDASCDPMSPEARDVSTSRERPLQGQSPFVVNAYLDYDNDKSGTSARLLYNAFGRRIDQVMGLGAPDIYEEAQHQFDFVFGQKVYKELALSLAVENIANWPIRLTQGPDRAITYLTWPGTTFTLGLSWKY
jgi:TonB-dependent receptor